MNMQKPDRFDTIEKDLLRAGRRERILEVIGFTLGIALSLWVAVEGLRMVL